jgi:hypothetical protein
MWCPLDMYLADGCVLTKHRTWRVFLPSLLHACPRHGPWATCIRLSCKGGERVFAGLKLGPTSQGRKPWQKNIDSPGMLGVVVGLTAQPRKIICHKIRSGKPGPTQDCRTKGDLHTPGTLTLIISLFSLRNLSVVLVWCSEGVLNYCKASEGIQKRYPLLRFEVPTKLTIKRTYLLGSIAVQSSGRLLTFWRNTLRASSMSMFKPLTVLSFLVWLILRQDEGVVFLRNVSKSLQSPRSHFREGSIPFIIHLLAGAWQGSCGHCSRGLLLAIVRRDPDMVRLHAQHMR